MQTIVIASQKRTDRENLTSILKGSGAIRVSASTRNLMETYNAVEELNPDAVLISHEMTLLEEFEVMRALFTNLGVRWLVLKPKGLEAGVPPPKRYDLFSVHLDSSISNVTSQVMSILSCPPRRRPTETWGKQMSKGKKILLIGASTGGVDALTRILSDLPKNCPPTFIVQHTGRGFGNSLVRLLDRQCSATVHQAHSGLILDSGNVCVGAGLHGHMVLKSGSHYAIDIETSSTVSGHMPSVDMLFKSALYAANSVVAILLTGMGRDGAEGLLALRNAGARTIAQDEKSSVVFGMPKSAIEMGGAEFILPLSKIADKALRLTD